MRSAVVVGKFYPPHHGHKHLIDTAQSEADDVFILVCDHPSQTIPAQLRAQWLREIHPKTHVVVVPDDLPDDDSVAWAQRTRDVLGFAPDAVFTSEDYGEPYSKALNCAHVQVDRSRTAVPCSGSMIRAHPMENLHYLEPCVRAHYVLRICLVGSESTGKTTLAQRLAERFETAWVPEFGREYSAEKMDGPVTADWDTNEFVLIAQEQQRREELAARKANKVLICDTDAFATRVWHERYMGFSSKEVCDIGEDLNNRLYLLANCDVPFVQDGLRDGELLRDWMQDLFLSHLKDSGRRYFVLTGDYDARMKQAVQIITAELERFTMHP